MTASGGRLYRAIRQLANKTNPAAIGVVSGRAGASRLLVTLNGAVQDVPLIGGATAETGDSVAVLIDTQTGQPIGVLGTVRR